MITGMEPRASHTSQAGSKRYTLRTPVPLRSEEDMRTTRMGLPVEPTLALTGPVDHDSLAKAIRRSVGHEGMRAEDARSIAAHVLNFFGFNERIIDNVLEPDDRDTFYMLEDSGILETERDETTLYDGREWRIHYWMFRKDRIFELALQESRALAEAGEVDLVYSANASRPSLLQAAGAEGHPNPDSQAMYHDLGDEIWLERRRTAPTPAVGTTKGRTRPVRAPTP
jgi:Family of unknown function (DUF6015)